MNRTRFSSLLLSTLLLAPAPALAQNAPGPFALTASAGLAVTAGNTSTSTINAAYEALFDPKTKNVVKSDGLYLRGKTEGVVSTNRLNLNVRDQYALSPRAFVYGQTQYLQDEFKNIDFLVAPTGGLGYKLLDSARTKLAVDAGVGAVWERDLGATTRSSGAITVAEKLSHNLTATTSLTHTFSALWKTQDTADALYIFGAGIAVSISTRTQLKVELLDTYKNRPQSAAVKKNDVALLTAIVFKM